MLGGQRHVALIGPMGSGKSTLGRRLASTLGVEFVDNDGALQRRTGVDARTIEASEGGDALHAAEASVLLEMLDVTTPSVVAAAASTIEDEACRQALTVRAFTVWLHGDLADLALRAKGGAHRPLDDDAVAQLRHLGRRRDPLYAEVADLDIDVSATGVAAATDAIVEHLRLRE